MNRSAALLAAGLLLLGATAVRAQPTMELVRACNAIEDAARRLECLRAAIYESPPAADNRDAPVAHAFQALQWQIDAGVGLRDYKAAVGRATQRLAEYSAGAPPFKKAGTARLQLALEAYRDAETFWSATTDFYGRRENAIAYFGGVPMDQVGLGWMVPKYKLPTRNADLLGLYQGVPAAAGRAAIWARARQLVADGLQLLRDPPWGPAEFDALRAGGEKAARRLLGLAETDAVFRGLFAGRPAGSASRTLCGELIALRPDGTATPSRRFYSEGGEAAMLEDPADPAFEARWSTQCGNRVHSYG